MTTPVNAAILGFGFMGTVHARALLRATRDDLPCRLTTILSPGATELAPPDRFPLPDDVAPMLKSVALARSLDDILSSPDINLVSICTPTPTHIDLARRALLANKHVLIEKPLALSAPPIQSLADTARAARRLAMPAMCMRFWPEWRFMADAVRDKRFGSLRRAAFQRLGAPPDWNPFYADHALSGGPLFDLHIHDADFILAALGQPTAVETTGDPLHLTTRYTIPEHDAPITAEASWKRTPDEGFAMRCTIELDDATLDFDLARSPQLLITQDSAHSSPTLSPLDAYDTQTRALISAIAENHPAPPVTLEDALAVTRLLRAEAESLDTARPVAL